MQRKVELSPQQATATITMDSTVELTAHQPPLVTRLFLEADHPFFPIQVISAIIKEPKRC